MILRNLFTGQQWRRHREQTYGHGRGEERVKCMERVTWTLTLPYVKQTACGNLYRELKPGACDDLEEWDVVGAGREGTYVYP